MRERLEIVQYVIEQGKERYCPEKEIIRLEHDRLQERKKRSDLDEEGPKLEKRRAELKTLD